jgi:hypothetical protein
VGLAHALCLVTAFAGRVLDSVLLGRLQLFLSAGRTLFLLKPFTFFSFEVVIRLACHECNLLLGAMVLVASAQECKRVSQVPSRHRRGDSHLRIFCVPFKHPQASFGDNARIVALFDVKPASTTPFGKFWRVENQLFRSRSLGESVIETQRIGGALKRDLKARNGIAVPGESRWLKFHYPCRTLAYC